MTERWESEDLGQLILGLEFLPFSNSPSNSVEIRISS